MKLVLASLFFLATFTEASLALEVTVLVVSVKNGQPSWLP